MTDTLHPSSRAPHDPSATEDQTDVGAAVEGDQEAFGRLVLRHQQAVLNSVYYFLGDYQDALEVAQESFFKAYRSLAGFRSESSFRTWLLRIALNTARSLQAKRRAKKRGGKPISLSGAEVGGPDVEVPDERGGPDKLLLRKEIKEALEEAITALDAESRQIIVLRDISGESYESMSSALGIPVGTVKSKVHRARLELRRKMERFL